MRIALVRGPSLNPYEMQNEVPLLPRFDLRAFATRWSPEWNSRLAQLPVDYFPWPDYPLKKLPRLRTLFNGLCSRGLGFSFYLPGLESALAGYSVIHTLETHNTFSYQAAKAAQRYGAKLLVTVWETIPGRGESHPLRRMHKKYVLQRADGFIAVTPRAARMLETEGADPRTIHIIPMGIDQSHFHPLPVDSGFRNAWRAREGEFIWLCVARLVPEKGIAELFHAFAKTSMPSRLVLVGGGPQQKEFERLSVALGIADRITFAGSYAYAQMPTVYASADALVLASRPTDWWEEQFGYCLVEAMTCGKPIVATQSGAIPEVLGPVGLLTPSENASALGDQMNALMQDKNLYARQVAMGIERARAEFSHLKTAEKLAAVYEKVASR